MGQLCYKNVREPQSSGTRRIEYHEVDSPAKQQPYYSTTNVTNQSNDSQKENNNSNNSNNGSNNYKNNNVVEQMKSKKINTKKLCRPSKVIQEQSSLYHRDTEQASCASNYSGYYDVNINPQESAAVSMFINSNSHGQQVKIGDTVILRNLKNHFYLFCKYQKLKKYDKQNLVKLEKLKDDHNEIYLTWKFKSIHPENNYFTQQQQSPDGDEVSSPEYESIDMGDQEIENNQCIKIQHVMTSCFLQSNKNCRHDANSKINHGQLVSGGPHNKITSHQQWTIEFFNQFSHQNQQPLHVNQLFKIKHTETNTYLTSYQNEVCCIKLEDLMKQFEEEKNNSDSIQECKENSNSISKTDQSGIEQEDDKRDSVDTSANPTDSIDDNNLAAAVGTDNQNENDQTPTTLAGESHQQSSSTSQKKKEHEEKPRLSSLQITTDLRRSERCSIDSALHRNKAQKLYIDSFAQEQHGQNTYIDVNCKSTEQIEIANLINDEAMSENGESLFRLKQQQYLNDQINNDFYKMNNYSQQIAIQEREMIRKKQEQFLQVVANGDLWYISEVIPHQ